MFMVVGLIKEMLYGLCVLGSMILIRIYDLRFFGLCYIIDWLMNFMFRVNLVIFLMYIRVILVSEVILL